MRLKAALAVAIAALSMVACGSSSGSPATAEPAAPGSPAGGSGAGVSVHLSDFKISPGQLTAPAGATSFAVKNDGPTPHNLTIRDGAGKTVGATANLKPGDSTTLTVSLNPGKYTAFCSLAGHESLGMSASLVVS